MTRPLHPSARDAALARVTRLTTGIVALGVASTLGLGAAIAVAAPESAGEPTDFSGGPTSTPTPDVEDDGASTPTLAPPDDRPESSSGDEDTTSGGS